MTFAWHGAVIPLQKKIPRLQDLVRKASPAPAAPRATPWEASLAAAMAWNQRINAKT